VRRGNGLPRPLAGFKGTKEWEEERDRRGGKREEGRGPCLDVFQKY